MKIAFYNHTSAVSGAEISLLLTAAHLTEAQPVLFAPEGELLDRAAIAGIPTVPLPSYRARLSRNPLRLMKDAVGILGSGFRFARAVRRERVDLVHANSLRAGIMASLFRWYHRRPVIWHARDMPPGGVIGAAIRRLAGSSADAVIGISQSVTDSFGANLKAPCRLVHNGVDIRDFTDEQKKHYRESLRREMKTPPKSKVLAIIGQIAPWKRQEDAIRAAAELVRLGYDIRLWIVGEAKFRKENTVYEQSLRDLVAELNMEELVTFTGFRQDVQEICCAADLLLLCSDNEPFGRVLIEAMIQGVPVVATNSGGVPEIVVHGENGLLYKVGDVRGLTENAARLLRDELLRFRFGKAAEERVRRHFTIQQTAGKVEEIYRDLLPASRRGVPRVAIVHDYMNQMGGAERVVAVMHRMFPEAPIYTTIADRSRLFPELAGADIRTTWMQGIPGILKRFKQFFWLYPFAVRSMKLQDYDLILSSSSAYGKGAPVPQGAVHVCYCHTPMRFAWDFDSYMESVQANGAVKRIARWMVAPLRRWDVKTTQGVDRLIANSTIVQQRINRHYGRNVPVIYPPVHVSRFEITQEPIGDYFLVVSRLVSYKRIDLAVEACTRLDKKLIVIGDGPDRGRLEAMAGPSVTFLGRLPDEEVVGYMQRSRAFLFPGLEDFGITPLEVNACGRPVIAFRGGGALDTVVPGLNGLFFHEQKPESLMEVLAYFDERQYDPERIRRHAQRFDEERFIEELSLLIQRALRRPAGTAAAEAAADSAIRTGDWT